MFNRIIKFLCSSISSIYLVRVFRKGKLIHYVFYYCKNYQKKAFRVQKNSKLFTIILFLKKKKF